MGLNCLQKPSEFAAGAVIRIFYFCQKLIAAEMPFFSLEDGIAVEAGCCRLGGKIILLITILHHVVLNIAVRCGRRRGGLCFDETGNVACDIEGIGIGRAAEAIFVILIFARRLVISVSDLSQRNRVLGRILLGGTLCHHVAEIVIGETGRFLARLGYNFAVFCCGAAPGRRACRRELVIGGLASHWSIRGCVIRRGFGDRAVFFLRHL